MGGTKEGGVKARNTNYKQHGKNFYARIGAIGGKLGHTGGFASNKIGADGLSGKERASTVGVIGGKKSRRRKG